MLGIAGLDKGEPRSSNWNAARDVAPNLSFARWAASSGRRGEVDIAVWMSPEVLTHKLEARGDRHTLVAWNVAHLPAGLGRPDVVDRLFVASAGSWRGYFILAKDVLWSPDDPAASITLLLDAATWTPIARTPARRFRGLRPLAPDDAVRPAEAAEGEAREGDRQASAPTRAQEGATDGPVSPDWPVS